jgi:MoxR-like ATPase
VSYADIKAAAAMCLRHRVLLNFEAEADRVDVDGLVKQIIDLTPTDPVKVGA